MSTHQTFDPFHQPSNQPGIPLLGACLPANAGRVSVAYDATTREPLRLRNADRQRLDGDTHDHTRQVIVALNAALRPLQVDYCKAITAALAGRAPELDAWRTQAGIVVMIGPATHHPALDGLLITLRASVRLTQSRANAYDIDADLRVRLDDDDGVEAAAAAAAKSFSATATRAWALCAREVLAPWLIGSGVHELRLVGAFRPQCVDPRTAGHRHGSPTPPSVH
jgi:hypothetical protein